MKLIFVYNADGSFSATMRDTIRKIVSPGTQECDLCRITYPRFAMDRQWSEFTKSLPHQVLFLHRDEFRTQYPNKKDMLLPAVFTEDAAGLQLLIPREDINKARDVNDLISTVRKTLSLTA